MQLRSVKSNGPSHELDSMRKKRVLSPRKRTCAYVVDSFEATMQVKMAGSNCCKWKSNCTSGFRKRCSIHLFNGRWKWECEWEWILYCRLIRYDWTKQGEPSTVRLDLWVEEPTEVWQERLQSRVVGEDRIDSDQSRWGGCRGNPIHCQQYTRYSSI